MKSSKQAQDLVELAAEKLGEALAEAVVAQEAEDPGDREHRRYVLKDLNSLLGSAGPGAEVQPYLLGRPEELRRHLQACLETPARVLARELPKRLAGWLKEEPAAGAEARPEWAAKGRWLLEQARLDQSQ
jgi:hypothetical protein